MNVVLYSNDLEPITVLSLELERGYLAKTIKERRGFLLSIPPDLRDLIGDDPPHLFRPNVNYVRIDVEYFIRDGKRHLMLVTRDEEGALRLKSAFLPGQQAAVRDQYERGIVDGIKTALGFLA